MEQNQWHTLELEQIQTQLKTSFEQGLSPELAQERLEEYGPNELEEKKKAGPLKIFLSQFNDFIIWILCAAAFISGVVLREAVDSLAILAILVLNAILGFIQEYRAERALEALKKMAAPTAQVIRGGEEKEIEAREVTPGDIFLLETGDHIPADGRIISCSAFSTQEAALTGESRAVTKEVGRISEKNLPLGDRLNMVYSGTTVATGRAKAVAAATGSETEVGRVAELIQEKEEKTPLQNELKRVGARIATLCLIICAIVFATGVVRVLAGRSIAPTGQNPYALLFLAAVSLAVAAIPEGLPAAVTVSLAIGVQTMARKNAIVRKLHAVETLGATTFICTDKTGTLTRNQMTVTKGYVAGKRVAVEPGGEVKNIDDLKKIDLFVLKTLFTIATLCNDARRTKEGPVGDPTEVALLAAAENSGLVKKELELTLPRVGEIPFDSQRKEMTTIHQKGLGYVAFTKGAPEIVLSQSSSVLLKEETTVPLTQTKEILETAAALASEGYRVLALAYKKLPQEPQKIESSEIEKDLVFVGLLGMTDPPRPEVYPALKTCQDAHIRVSMITGDHLLTARSIAREINLLDHRETITGDKLEKLSDEELLRQAENIAVYARVAPAHKVRIVKALKDKGHVVAVTGDGVNDAPALKKADIGVAMGVVGTDVTREASDMVLADDNFATIVAAAKEGRSIFNNIRKFILFLLSCNVSEVLVMFTSMVFLGILPLWPIQILWINLITDGLPALALGVDPAAADLMKRKPRGIKESILVKERQKQILLHGLLLTVGALLAFTCALYWLELPLERARTILFVTMVLSQLIHSLNFRSEKATVFSGTTLANKLLLLAIGASILLQIGIVYLPFAQPIFHTVWLSLKEWLLILITAIFPIVLIDWWKTATDR